MNRSAFRRPPDMPRHVQLLVDQIPAGRVASYGAVARALGDVAASRWVADFLLHDGRAVDLPSHRVVRSDGTLGLYAGDDSDEKRRRLEEEGIETAEGIELQRVALETFRTTRPLLQLAGLQNSLRAEISLRGCRRPPRYVGGVDVSYRSAERGVAAYSLVDATSGELVWSTTVSLPARFPYITSYLAFRELPLLLDLMDEVKTADRVADLVLVDGAGIMHPRQTGVASLLGVLANVPTVGVTKKFLFGSCDLQDVQMGQLREVLDGRRRLGAALRPRESSKKLIYVSPGHRVGVDAALRVALAQLRGRRLPAPIYWADRLSRQAARANSSA